MEAGGGELGGLEPAVSHSAHAVLEPGLVAEVVLDGDLLHRALAALQRAGRARVERPVKRARQDRRLDRPVVRVAGLQGNLLAACCYQPALGDL